VSKQRNDLSPTPSSERREEATTWLAFGPFLLDPKKGVLLRGEETVKLRGKTMAVLCHLVQRGGAVVARDELLAAIWPDVTVQSETLATSIAELRRLFGDSRTAAQYIETRHGQGFRFVPPVRIVRDISHSDPASVVPGAVPAFIGRTDELATLQRAMEDAWNGRSRQVAIWGPSGIGKTRLLEQFAGEAMASGARALWGRAAHTSEHSAFWIWTQIVRAFAEATQPAELRAALGNAASDIALIAPSIQDRLPDLAPAELLPPEIAYTRLFDGITSFLSRLAAQRPLVLILDDIHMASASSLALLQAVVSDLSSARLLLLVAYRAANEHDSPGLASTLQTMHDHGATSLRLGGLAESEVRALITAAAAAPLTRELIDKIVADTGGNPYFVLEIVRSLQEHGSVPGAPYRIPDSVSRALQDRLAKLQPQTRLFLTAAAVCGPDLEASVAAAAAGLDRDSLIAAAAEAVDAGLLESSSSAGRLSFSHELLREKLWRDLPRLTRADFHERIGEALERNPSPQYRELAHHFGMSASVEGRRKAVRYGLLAAKQALGQYSNGEARQLLERARQLAEQCEPAVSAIYCEILERLSEAYFRTGDWAAARAAATQLHTVARALGDPSWLARAALALSPRTYLPGRSPHIEESLAALRESLAGLPAELPLLRAQLQVRLATTLLSQSGSDEERVALARQAIATARAKPSAATDATTAILDEAIVALWDADHREEQLEVARHVRDLGSALNNRYLRCHADSWTTLDLLGHGRVRQAEAVIAAAEPEVLALGSPAAERYLLRAKIHIAILRGEIALAEEKLETYRAVRWPTDPVAGPLELTFLELTVDREKDRIGDRGRLLRSLSPVFPGLGLAYAAPYLLLQGGHREEARAELQRIASQFGEIPRNESCGWLTALTALADACAELGDRKLAADLYPLLQPYEEHWPIVFFAAAVFGSAGRALGRLAAVLGAHDRAEQHFEKVIALCTAEGIVTERCRAQLDYAAAIADTKRRQRGHNPDQLRREALGRAEEHQLTAILRRAYRELGEQ